jgi:CheY-like chemotaxis protein
MASPRVLLVDDNDSVRSSLEKALEASGFEVVSAGSAPEALIKISLGRYDVLLSDLHLVGTAEELSVLTAMRHANPRSRTLLLSGSRDSEAKGLPKQAETKLQQSMNVIHLLKAVQLGLNEERGWAPGVESVATILERTAVRTIQAWLRFVHDNDELMHIAASDRERVEHLPRLVEDVVRRLQSARVTVQESGSQAAAIYGARRRQQGFSAAMIVEESRLLHICLMDSLQQNLGNVDSAVLLPSVRTIADEVDAQLSLAMEAYTAEMVLDGLADDDI